MKARASLRLLFVAVMVCALMGLPSFAPTAHADGFIDFESGDDGEPIRSSIPGLQFTTTQGYDWIYGDWRTGKYNGPYPNNGKYYSNGNFFAWLGPNQGMGQIDFTLGGATYIQVWVSSATGLSVEAYNSQRKQIGTAHVAGNLSTGQLARLRVTAPAGEKIAYVQFHDSGNQWLIDDLSTDAAGVPEQRPPIIVIPGLMGSELDYYNHVTGNAGPVWPPFYDSTTRTVDTTDIDYGKLLSRVLPMFLAADGASPSLPIYKVYSQAVLKDISKLTDKNKPPAPDPVYGPLVRRLEAAGYKVYEFHYDWRKDVRGALTGHGTTGEPESLDSFIDRALAETGATKVNIVAHSLGGLVTRAYVSQSEAHARKVDQAIILGTPYLGAPHALWGLRSGFKGMGGWTSDYPYLDVVLRELVQNYPSVYEIVPSQRYWDLVGDWYYKNGKAQSWTQLQSMLIKEHNQTLPLVALQLHGVVDYWGDIPGGTAFRFIAGSGMMNTPGKLIEQFRLPWQGGTYWDVTPTNGDGTVTIESASLQSVPRQISYRGNVPIWYADGLDHQQIVKQDYVLDFIVAMLATAPSASTDAETQAVPEVSAGDLLAPQAASVEVPRRQVVNAPPLPPGMSEKPFPLDGAQIAVFNAIELHLYDSAGRHTGPRANGSIEVGIPRSSYERIGPGLFATVPAGGTYRTEIVPIRGEQFDMRVRDVEGIDTNVIQRTIVYDSMRLPDTASGSVIINPDNLNVATEMSIDLNGDGKPESTVRATSDLSDVQSYDFQGPQASISASGAQNSRGYTGNVRITVNASDNLSGLLNVKYSLDGGRTFRSYSGPFVVTAETNPSIWADASDRAGNHTLTHLRLIPLLMMLPGVGASSGAAAPETWHLTNGLAGRAVLDLSSAGSACNTVFAATDAGIFRSVDGGLGWEQRLAPPAEARTEVAPRYEGAAELPAVFGMSTAVAVCQANPAIVYAGSWGNGIYRSTDGGASWQPRAGGLADPWIYDLAVAENNCETVYAATSGGGVFKTGNGGGSWQPANSGLGNLLTRALAIAPGNPNRLYAGTTGGVWRSDSAGANWTAANNQLPAATVWSLAAVSGGDLLYAGLDGRGVYRSTSAGSAWSAAAAGLGDAQVRALIVDPQAASTLYAGREDGGGVYRSVDGGAGWSAFNDGLGSLAIKSLWRDGGACHRLLAGTTNGVWRFGQ